MKILVDNMNQNFKMIFDQQDEQFGIIKQIEKTLNILRFFFLEPSFTTDPHPSSIPSDPPNVSELKSTPILEPSFVSEPNPTTIPEPTTTHIPAPVSDLPIPEDPLPSFVPLSTTIPSRISTSSSVDPEPTLNPHSASHSTSSSSTTFDPTTAIILYTPPPAPPQAIAPPPSPSDIKFPTFLPNGKGEGE